MSRALTERWDPDATAAAFRSLQIGRPASPFGNNEGRVDLRGLQFGRAVPGGRTKNLDVKAVDFSYADLEQLRIEKSRFSDCRFDRADCRNFGDYGNHFLGCTFDHTVLIGSAIGYDGSRYVDCHFTKNSLNKTSFSRAEFDRCTFDNVKLSGVDFSGSSFDDCAFIGRIEDVWFRGGYAVPSDQRRFGKARPNKMRNVDFSEAELWEVTFSDGCHLSSVILPADGSHLWFDRWKQRVACAIAGTADPDILAFLKACVPHAERQDQYILGRREIEAAVGPDKAPSLIELLSRG